MTMSPPHPHTAASQTLTAVPLSPKTFTPYGDVIESTGSSELINQGNGRRYADLARVELTAAAGRASISRVTCFPETPPVALRVMERHPLGSQAFIPVNGQRYLVIVAPAGAPPRPDALHAFVANGDQGINYHRGVWHHPMIALDVTCDFLEVHRAGPGNNCDEVEIEMATHIRLPGDGRRV
jgi:ureidoglycolate lyase